MKLFKMEQVDAHAKNKAHLAAPISFPSQTGRGWPKPGAALHEPGSATARACWSQIWPK